MLGRLFIILRNNQVQNELVGPTCFVCTEVRWAMQSLNYITCLRLSRPDIRFCWIDHPNLFVVATDYCRYDYAPTLDMPVVSGCS